MITYGPLSPTADLRSSASGGTLVEYAEYSSSPVGVMPDVNSDPKPSDERTLPMMAHGSCIARDSQLLHLPTQVLFVEESHSH